MRASVGFSLFRLPRVSVLRDRGLPGRKDSPGQCWAARVRGHTWGDSVCLLAAFCAHCSGRVWGWIGRFRTILVIPASTPPGRVIDGTITHPPNTDTQVTDASFFPLGGSHMAISICSHIQPLSTSCCIAQLGPWAPGQPRAPAPPRGMLGPCSTCMAPLVPNTQSTRPKLFGGGLESLTSLTPI